jgi:hypothetical protein
MPTLGSPSEGRENNTRLCISPLVLKGTQNGDNGVKDPKSDNAISPQK